MMDDSGTLPVPIGAGGNRALSTLDQLAEIPEEDIWLAKQKSARTRRAYRLDVQHFMRTLSITTRAELRQADHKAVIAWKRYMRETGHAASSTEAAAVTGATVASPLPDAAIAEPSSPNSLRSAIGSRSPVPQGGWGKFVRLAAGGRRIRTVGPSRVRIGALLPKGMP
jgi:hypothetical protein